MDDEWTVVKGKKAKAKVKATSVAIRNNTPPNDNNNNDDNDNHNNNNNDDNNASVDPKSNVRHFAGQTIMGITNSRHTIKAHQLAREVAERPPVAVAVQPVQTTPTTRELQQQHANERRRVPKIVNEQSPIDDNDDDDGGDRSQLFGINKQKNCEFWSCFVLFRSVESKVVGQQGNESTLRAKVNRQKRFM